MQKYTGKVCIFQYFTLYHWMVKFVSLKGLNMPAAKKKVAFLIPTDGDALNVDTIARPYCKTAYYFCLLAGKKQLSIKELYIIEKIGFCIDIKYE